MGWGRAWGAVDLEGRVLLQGCSMSEAVGHVGVDEVEDAGVLGGAAGREAGAEAPTLPGHAWSYEGCERFARVTLVIEVGGGVEGFEDCLTNLIGNLIAEAFTGRRRFGRGGDDLVPLRAYRSSWGCKAHGWSP